MIPPGFFIASFAGLVKRFNLLGKYYLTDFGGGTMLVSLDSGAVMKKQTTINMSPEAFRELLVAASYYLGGAVERVTTKGQSREVTNVRGTFDELIDQIDADAEDRRAGGM